MRNRSTVMAWATATCGVALAAVVFASSGPQAANDAVRRVRDSAGFKTAMTAIDRDHDRLVAEIVRLTEIPAPPFKEAARAKVFAEMLRQSGLADTTIDAEGNVIGVRKGTGAGPLIAIAAHLDTVFPEGTDVKVKRDGTRLMAPGIGDDTRGLAVLLAMVRAMNEARIATASDILFIGDVGEEGQGDLRGMKYLFQKGPYRDRIKMFISIDGAGGGDDITHGAVGSKRYRVTFKGPGGHSYGAFGIVSPAFALGNAIRRFSALTVPTTPKTTFSVGVLGGGTSVNSIPFESWMEIDMRSESAVELAKLDKTFLALLQQAADEENATRSTAQGPITVDPKLIGDRPSGQTSHDSPIVQTAASVVQAVGMKPRFSFSSTDSNIPISIGIPAITVDSGGRGGRAHALDEWIDVEKSSSLPGIRSALILLLTSAGLK